MENNQIVATPKENGMGIAGFSLAILGLLFCWVPVLGFVLWVLGLVFSIIGVCRRPRGLAIAGIVISCISLIVVTIVLWAIFGIAAASM